MKRLIEKTVFWGLVTAWRLATVPTSRSPDWVNATTDGVVRPPSAFSMTVGSPPSSTAMHEFVVPRSIPIVFPICVLLPVGRKNLSGSVADLAVRAGIRVAWAERQRPNEEGNERMRRTHEARRPERRLQRCITRHGVLI